MAVYGGDSMERQIHSLQMKPEIVVACPGRLLDHLWRGTISLSGLKILVIDEADRMFDMGFLPDIRNILKCIMHERQTLLFSATMPADIRRLANEVLTNPVTVQIDRQLPARTVSHCVYPVQPHLKTSLLKEILNNTRTDSVLIFTRTKHRARRLTQQIARDGYKAAALHGDLSQGQRQASLKGFRSGSVKILIATDIAARGIDVSSISHVINFDMPQSTEDYIHRIGRTGRVGRVGDALTLVTGADKDMVRSLERLLNKSIEQRMLDSFDYAKPAPVREGVRPMRRSRQRTRRVR
jgi:ATP-dependent RNA helicase RhlE